jgi:hypothetical protein
MEAFPLLAGFTCGLLVGVTTGRWRMWQVAVVSVLLGFAATVLTGEWRTSWLFLLVDVPLVAGSALFGCLAARMVRARISGRGRPRM